MCQVLGPLPPALSSLLAGPLSNKAQDWAPRDRRGSAHPGSDMEPGRGQAGEMGGGAIGNQVLGRCCGWKWVNAAHLGHCLGGGRCHRVLPELLWKTQ